MNSVLDHPLLNSILFYPRRLEPRDFPSWSEGSLHLIPVNARERISAYWYRPRPEQPTVLFFHGNGEVITDYLYDYHQAIAKAGANFAVVDYRGYGLSDGRPSLDAILEDGRAAWDYFRDELGLSPRELVVMGRSLGSIPALEVAATVGRNCRGVIIESGIAGFGRWLEALSSMLGRLHLNIDTLQEELRSKLDHAAKVKQITRPLLILHTELDQIVPVWNARELYSFAEPSRATLKIFARGDHNSIFLVNAGVYFQTIHDFLETLAE